MDTTEKLADTIPQTCHALAISRTRCYEEIAAGRLKAKKSGNRTLVTREAQKDWLDALPELKLSSEVA